MIDSDRSLAAFIDTSGNEVARLRLIDVQGAPSIRNIDPGDAAERGEESVQLMEGRAYEYELLAGESLKLERTAVVQPSAINSTTGMIEPGTATGLLTIRLLRAETGELAGIANIEVRTRKIDYHSHYRKMLADVSEASCALLLDIRAPTRVRLSGDQRDPDSLHEQFVLLRSLLERGELRDALSRLLDLPHRRWMSEQVETDPRRPFPSARSIAAQIASRSPRLRLSHAHPLAETLRALGFDNPSIPAQLTVERQSESLDTPENRFVKFVLEEWESFLVQISVRLDIHRSPATDRVQREVVAVRKQVSGWLAQRLFTEVGRLESLPLGSPVLQRKSGYREVLQSWLTFRAGTALIWTSGRDVFGGGNKDVALLYEYWVFFELIRIVEQVFRLETPAAKSLLEQTDDGLDLKLRSGQTLDLSGEFEGGSRPLRIRFSYNRTFVHSALTDRKVNYPSAGSWTKSMRPDYTLSLWPAEFSEREAERQELITHVHFDAKYRVDEIGQLFGADSIPDDELLTEEKIAFRTNQTAKRADLLKMHAYRDAIRRSEGAYVIYPGATPTESQEWWAFHELLPGLGAFSLRPGATETSYETLRQFIEDVALFTCDEATRLEQQTYHTFRIQEDSGAFRATPELPTRDRQGRGLRKRPRAER